MGTAPSGECVSRSRVPPGLIACGGGSSGGWERVRTVSGLALESARRAQQGAQCADTSKIRCPPLPAAACDLSPSMSSLTAQVCERQRV